MTMRTNLTEAARMASMSVARGSVRDFDDENLMQELKAVDVLRGETATNEGYSLERFQMVGLTAVPLKQDEDEKKQGQQGQQGQGQQGGGSKDGTGQGVEENTGQPEGKSAEALMLYVGGQRSHPVAMVDDRRVRPYAMKNGEGAHYAPNGSGQMAYHKVADDGGKGEGYYLVTRDGKAYGKDAKEVDRMISIRHVEKELQTRDLPDKHAQGGGQQQGQQQQQQQKKHKHEGDKVNLEMRVNKKRIEFRSGDKVVGYYDKDSATWVFIGKVKLGKEDADHAVYGLNKETGKGQTTLKDGEGAVFVKAPEPGPPTSLDKAP
jgi:hypothetical protein